jgi:glycosyltransferase involved in cell wall biosynthesis
MKEIKKKVCFVTPFFYPVIGGVETHILESGKELMKKGWKVYVVTSDSDRFGKVEKKEEIYEGIQVIRCKTLAKVTFGEVFFPAAKKVIEQINPDIIHFHAFRHWYNLLPFVFKQPCFITPHWPDYRGQRHHAVQAIADVMDFTIGKNLLSVHDKICIVTEDERSWVRAFSIPNNKILLTPNALPSEYNKSVKPGNFRKKYELGDKPVILSVARIHRSKGLDQLIKAATLFPECEFVIIGKDGGAQEELEALIKRLGITNVQFTGPVSEKEKRQAYASADIFCLPSHFEAFGIAILEAMSHGLPCIVTRKGGMPWVVQDTGLLFEEDNVEQLENQLKRLIENDSLRAKLGTKAKKRAKEFTWKKTAAILDKEYRKQLT